MANNRVIVLEDGEEKRPKVVQESTFFIDTNLKDVERNPTTRVIEETSEDAKALSSARVSCFFCRKVIDRAECIELPRGIELPEERTYAIPLKKNALKAYSGNDAKKYFCAGCNSLDEVKEYVNKFPKDSTAELRKLMEDRIIESAEKGFDDLFKLADETLSVAHAHGIATPRYEQDINKPELLLLSILTREEAKIAFPRYVKGISNNIPGNMFFPRSGSMQTMLKYASIIYFEDFSERSNYRALDMLITDIFDDRIRKNLIVLDLARCKLVGIPPSISLLTGLKTLFITGNELRTLPGAIADMPSLNSIYASNNKITTLPKRLFASRSIEHISLYSNDLKTMPRCISKMQGLESLDLRENRLMRIPKGACGMPNLRDLKLDRNPIKEMPEIKYGRSSPLTISLNETPIHSLPKSVRKMMKKGILKCEGKEELQYNIFMRGLLIAYYVGIAIKWGIGWKQATRS